MKMKQTKIKPVFLFLFTFILSGALMAGCTQNRQSTSKQETIAAQTKLNELQYKLSPEETVPVIRYGRYQLVEIGATPEQRSLLSQIIDLNIPLTANNKTTVTQGLNYLLLNSGYRLCSTQTIEPLSRLELPLAHYYLGPIRLQEALEVLVGNAWQLNIDESERTVCFAPISSSVNAQDKKESRHEIK